MSPEIIHETPYNFKTDIWSLGVLLYEMCALTYPFKAESIPTLAMKIVSGKVPALPVQYGPEINTLLKQIMNVEASERPNIN
jgi:NIMA (never in mitosis gene a)-related kinase